VVCQRRVSDKTFNISWSQFNKRPLLILVSDLGPRDAIRRNTQSIVMVLPATNSDERTQAIVLIDGVCVLCSRSYRFVSTRDTANRFRFVTIQQPEGRTLAERHGIDPQDPTTFILVENDVVRFRSDAALRILGALPGWRWTRLLRVVPQKLRDRLYDLIARNRYRWFGRLDACILPTPPTSRANR
jgi:predicted DCC family thiol-disulfide oxidoreductase YuxK